MAKSSKNKKRASSRKSHQLAPVIRVKKRPRGKSFQPGNGFGAAWRFRKGICANPGGRPKSSEVGKAIRARLTEVDPHDPAGRTYAEIAADIWIEAALGGNVGALTSLADRAEGKPNVSLSLDDRDDSFLRLGESMNRHGLTLGPPPEDFDDVPTPLLGEGTQNDG
jgi:Family of unknown function (DUF5681)